MTVALEPINRIGGLNVVVLGEGGRERGEREVYPLDRDGA